MGLKLHQVKALPKVISYGSETSPSESSAKSR